LRITFADLLVVLRVNNDIAAASDFNSNRHVQRLKSDAKSRPRFAAGQSAYALWRLKSNFVVFQGI